MTMPCAPGPGSASGTTTGDTCPPRCPRCPRRVPDDVLGVPDDLRGVSATAGLGDGMHSFNPCAGRSEVARRPCRPGATEWLDDEVSQQAAPAPPVWFVPS